MRDLSHGAHTERPNLHTQHSQSPCPPAFPAHCPVPCARPPPLALPVRALRTALFPNNAGSTFCCSCFLRLPRFLKLLVLHS